MAEASVVELQGNGERAKEERPRELNISGNADRKMSSASHTGTPWQRPRMPLVLKELLSSRRPRVFSSSSQQLAASTELIASPHTGEENSDYPDREDVKVLKMGPLHKTSQSRRPNSEPGPTRQRRFRLTPEAIEYFQQFSHVKIRRNYPLTSLEVIEYPADGDKLEFKLYFSSYIMTLRSDSESDAEEWVEMIKSAWKEWQLPTPMEAEPGTVASPQTPPTGLHPILEEEVTVHSTRNSANRESFTLASPPISPSHPPPVTNPTPTDRPRSHSHTGFLRRESSDTEFPTYDKRRQRRIRGLIRKVAKPAPRLQKQQPHTARVVSTKLHEEHPMIKYPRSRWSIPAEKVVNLDKDNLVVIWKRHERHIFKKTSSSSTKHKLRRSLSLSKVLEVRRGQLTERFDQFPYEEVEDQSFSLMFEQVTKRYVRLTSLDLICDSQENCEDWINGLRETTNRLSSNMFPSEQYENTDPTIIWLKELWAISQSDHELSHKAAQEFLLMLRPGTLPIRCRQILSDSHHYQFRHTYLRNALRWDGFVLMFNLLLSNTGRLGALFKQYAVKYPKLGMTEEELKLFLTKECHWPESSCTSSELQALIAHHDYHHRAYKKFVVQGIPLDYQIGSTLLSYAGFLSFLRSKDNSPMMLENMSCCMDMTQPLSHYFINSSHNTYLEADQLYGKSSTDAYIRALLQGCRCIEIDCWDEKLNVKGVGEPLIYHGYTLTTKLPFREVIQTIREYAFTASLYPLIISIENHCSSAQQSKMAKIFQAVMGDVLPKENLCEKYNRDRLPSPQELQGMIILKGSFKLKAQAAQRRPPRLGTQIQQSSASLAAEESLSPTVKEPDMESTAVALLQAKQQLPSRRSIHRSPSSVHRRLKESVQSLQESGQLENTVYQDDDQELIFSETVGDMKSLIVYCRAISLRPWSFEKQAQTPVSNMFSFGEPSALRRCEKFPIEMLACTERQLVRTYPRGTRFDSANYPAMNLWQCGVQMVALNFQYPDVHMHLNQGLFRQNGGCGYVLKPKVMREREMAVEFDPRMTTPHPEVSPVSLEIELLSGQRLCYWERRCLSCSVDIHTYGIPHDTDTSSMATAQSGDLLWPQWQEGQHVLSKRILMPELCLVYFRVEVTRSVRASRKTTLYGQNCIPLTSLLPGIKYVPLRTPGGELIPESGLFLKIKKEEEVSVNREERGGVRRGVAKQRRKRLTHQQELSGDLDDDPTIDVSQSVFTTVRERVANGNGVRHEWEEEEEVEEIGVQRSATSPPLLESVTGQRKGQYSTSTERERESKGGRNEVEVTAEVHESAVSSVRSQQLLRVEPAMGAAETATSNGGQTEIESFSEDTKTKVFSLKFSDDEL